MPPAKVTIPFRRTPVVAGHCTRELMEAVTCIIPQSGIAQVPLVVERLQAVSPRKESLDNLLQHRASSVFHVRIYLVSPHVNI